MNIDLFIRWNWRKNIALYQGLYTSRLLVVFWGFLNVPTRYIKLALKNQTCTWYYSRLNQCVGFNLYIYKKESVCVFIWTLHIQINMPSVICTQFCTYAHHVRTTVSRYQEKTDKIKQLNNICCSYAMNFYFISLERYFLIYPIMLLIIFLVKYFDFN